MSDFQINDHLLCKEARALAQDIFEEWQDKYPAEFAAGNCGDYLGEMQDRAHETADGHEWVIYTYKAHALCLHCNTDKGEELLEDCGMPEDVTYDSLGTMIAFGELRGRIEEELQEMCDEHEPE